jgi:hypothetical protein
MAITVMVLVGTSATASTLEPFDTQFSFTNARADVNSEVGNINALSTFDECELDCDPQLDPNCPKLDF